MTCYFRQRMLYGKFTDDKEESKVKSMPATPTPQPPPPPEKSKPAAPKEDEEVKKLSNALVTDLHLQHPPDPWWEKVGKPGYDRYARYGDISAWQIESESKSTLARARNHSGGRPRAQTWTTATVARGRGGDRNGNSGHGQGPAPQRKNSTPAQATDNRRKPRRPWKTEKEKRAGAGPTAANNEPEKFVFSSTDVNPSAVNARAAGLSRVDPQYKAFLVSLAESYEKECGGKEEIWDD